MKLKPGTRCTVARMAQVVRLLKAGSNTLKIARLLEVSPKTIQRDLDCLRDFFDMPATYDEQTHQWILNPNWRFELA